MMMTRRVAAKRVVVEAAVDAAAAADVARDGGARYCASSL